MGCIKVKSDFKVDAILNKTRMHNLSLTVGYMNARLYEKVWLKEHKNRCWLKCSPNAENTRKYGR